MPGVIGNVFTKLSELASGEKELPETMTPAVPIRRSVTDDYIMTLSGDTRRPGAARVAPGRRRPLPLSFDPGEA